MTRRRDTIAVAVGVLVVVVLAIVAFTGDSGGGDGSDGPTDTTQAASAYVALGDSISAGGGAPPYDGPIPALCGQSTRSWTYVLHDLDPSISEPELAACGGAKIENVIGPWAERQQPAQVPEVPRPDIKLVTLTVGANDTAAGLLITYCVPQDCTGLLDGSPYRTSLTRLTTDLVVGAYPSIDVAFPQARIVHVGYARLTPPPGEPVVDCPWFTPSEQEQADETISLLNDAIEAATVEAIGRDVLYVDITDALAGHEACTADPWVNPADAGGDAFHPTAEGYEAIAAVVADALQAE